MYKMSAKSCIVLLHERLANMHTNSVIKRLLKIDKIVMENIYFEERDEEEILIIQVRPYGRELNRCPICRRLSPGYDSANKIKYWRSLDFGSTRVYIKACAPRIKCSEHGIIVASVPWARHDSEYTLEFEDAVTWLTLHATAKDVAEYFRIEWHTVGSIARRVQESLDAEKGDRFDNIDY